VTLKMPANERAFDAAQTCAVQPHFRRVVHAFEVSVILFPQGSMAYRTSCGTNNPAAQGIRNRQIVQPIIGIGINSACNERSQYRAGNDGRIPGRVIEIARDSALPMHRGPVRHATARSRAPRLPGSRLQAPRILGALGHGRGRAHPAGSWNAARSMGPAAREDRARRAPARSTPLHGVEGRH